MFFYIFTANLWKFNAPRTRSWLARHWSSKPAGTVELYEYHMFLACIHGNGGKTNGIPEFSHQNSWKFMAVHLLRHGVHRLWTNPYPHRTVGHLQFLWVETSTNIQAKVRKNLLRDSYLTKHLPRCWLNTCESFICFMGITVPKYANRACLSTSSNYDCNWNLVVARLPFTPFTQTEWSLTRQIEKTYDQIQPSEIKQHNYCNVRPPFDS